MTSIVYPIVYVLPTTFSLGAIVLPAPAFRGCCTGKCRCDRPEIPPPAPLSFIVPED